MDHEIADDDIVDNGPPPIDDDAPEGGAPPNEGQAAAEDDGTDPGGQVPERGGAAGGDWSRQGLPADLAKEFPDVKTMGDLAEKYRNGSASVRESQARSERLYDYTRQLQAQLRGQVPQPGQPAAVVAAPSGGGAGYFGFADRAAYDAAYKQDPLGTGQKVLRNQILQDKELRAELRKEFGADLAPLREQLDQRAAEDASARWQYAWGDFAGKRPQFAEGTPGWNQLDQVFRENPELMQMAQRDPRRALEVGARYLEADINQAKIAATDKREAERRRASASARPGGGGRSVNKNPKTTAEMLIADLESQGIEVDMDMVNQCAAKFDEADGK